MGFAARQLYVDADADARMLKRLKRKSVDGGPESTEHTGEKTSRINACWITVTRRC